MAEAILNRLGAGAFRAFSAGSEPKGQVHPLTLEILKARGYLTEGLRSKDLAEFELPSAPRMDFLFTVCDRAAQTCPVWVGAPIKAHWGVPDPVETEGDGATRRAAFVRAFESLEARVRRFLALPWGSMDSSELRRRLQEIGETSEPMPANSPVGVPV